MYLTTIYPRVLWLVAVVAVVLASAPAPAGTGETLAHPTPYEYKHGTSYCFRVVAVDHEGHSAYSAGVTVPIP